MSYNIIGVLFYVLGLASQTMAKKEIEEKDQEKDLLLGGTIGNHPVHDIGKHNYYYRRSVFNWGLFLGIIVQGDWLQKIEQQLSYSTLIYSIHITSQVKKRHWAAGVHSLVHNGLYYSYIPSY